MEPNKLSYGAELPEPVNETQAETFVNVSPEVKNTSQLSAPVSAQPIGLPTDTTPKQSLSSPQPTTSTNPALIADDADLIEKEWVLKAKAIVAQTAHDPNLQTKEIGKVKAEYLKTRYNKNLKLDES